MTSRPPHASTRSLGVPTEQGRSTPPFVFRPFPYDCVQRQESVTPTPTLLRQVTFAPLPFLPCPCGDLSCDSCCR
jgi:hypothetical protein